jgi:hypothetical protein
MNEEFELANNIELLTQGAIEKGNLNTCMIYGISGNCGKNCPKFKDKTCEEYLTTLENEYNNLQSKIDKAIEYVNTIKDNTPNSARKDFAKMILINYEFLLSILKEDK